MTACPNCGREPPADAAFCPSCGAPLGAPEPGHEERKLISVLFVDLVGSTAAADQADPEDVRDTLQAFHSRAKQEIERFGGTVEKFIGDAVMAVFGAPVAHGDDAERAVRAGLRVIDAIGELDRERPDVSLQLRAAVNTGDAVVSVGMRPESGDPLALGDVVNTASRLQNSAPVGRLIVGDETYRATRTMIRYQELDPIQAKGKKDPVGAWLALAPVGAPAERPATTAPLVGRTRELALLDSVWDRTAAERRPHLVTLVGPTGIGKSRMADEIRARAEMAGARTFTGRCLPYGQTPYRPFTEQIRAAAGIFESDGPEDAPRKLRERIAALDPSPEAEETTRLVGALLGVGASDVPAEEPLQLFFAARRIVELLASEQPTVFVFEDIHWADAAQLDLLEHLAMHVRDVPALFLALARSELLEVRPGWGSGILNHTAIPLEPLSPVDAASIASYLLSGGGDLSSVERLVEVAEGNPLFIEELAASLLDRGPSDELPTTVRAAIASRIDALPAEPRAALLAASVVGKHFWRGVLRSFDDLDGVDEALLALEARDLVRREPMSQVQGDAEFAFKHILIREVAYSTLARAERRRRHADVARCIEDAVAGQSRNLAWVLAHHWREAGEPERSLPYLVEAAELADEQLAFHHAVELYGSALELMAGDDPGRQDLTVKRLISFTRLSHAVFDAGPVRWERDAEQP
ncbi:MAG TPA: AAA family ATPase [Actinomycetota bacterium]|nr:AAA family ATPase [Actinomycetota bacterium]